MTDIVTDEMVLAAAKAQRPDIWDPETGEVWDGVKGVQAEMMLDQARRGLVAAFTSTKPGDPASLSGVLRKTAEVVEQLEAKVAGYDKDRHVERDRANAAVSQFGESQRLLEQTQRAFEDAAVGRDRAIEQRDIEAGHAQHLERELVTTRADRDRYEAAFNRMSAATSVNPDPFVAAVELLRSHFRLQPTLTARRVVEHVLNEVRRLEGLVAAANEGRSAADQRLVDLERDRRAAQELNNNLRTRLEQVKLQRDDLAVEVNRLRRNERSATDTFGQDLFEGLGRVTPELFDDFAKPVVDKLSPTLRKFFGLDKD